MIKKIQRTVKVRSLAEVELSIQNGHKSFIQLGEDYKAIRDGDYAEAKKAVSNRSLAYKEVIEKVLGYPTLADYWRAKWHLHITYVNRVIAASETMKELGNTKDAPKNVSVANELSKAPKGKRKEALKKATKGGKRQATAKNAKEAVEELLGKPSKKDSNGNILRPKFGGYTYKEWSKEFREIFQKGIDHKVDREFMIKEIDSLRKLAEAAKVGILKKAS